MFSFKCEDWVPLFIRKDKNGYALAKAIEAAVQYMNDKVKTGFEYLTDVSKMPEWRLDEMAWETNCLYDYGADIETKRRWIRNAAPYYRLYGTVKALKEYIGSFFDNVEIEEAAAYGGDPFHFRVTVYGDLTPQSEAWTDRAIAAAKNVRSVLDAVHIGQQSGIGLETEDSCSRFPFKLCGQDEI